MAYVLLIWGLLSLFLLMSTIKSKELPHKVILDFIEQLNIIGKILVIVIAIPSLIYFYVLGIILFCVVVVFEFLFVKKENRI